MIAWWGKDPDDVCHTSFEQRPDVGEAQRNTKPVGDVGGPGLVGVHDGDDCRASHATEREEMLVLTHLPATDQGDPNWWGVCRSGWHDD